MQEITFDEFKKADIRIGTILSAEKVPEADKLIKLMIDLGVKKVEQSLPSADGSPEHSHEPSALVGDVPDIRQILSGIAQYYPDPTVLIGKQVPVLTNLPVRTIRGLESQGMVLYAVGLKPSVPHTDGSPDHSSETNDLGGDFLITVNPERTIPNGTPVQ